MATLSRRALNRATLARQLLLARKKLTPLAAIEQLVALQAQVAKPPFVGLWSRVQDFQRAHLAELLRTKKVIRASLLRGTLHVMSTKDFLALRGAIQPALTAGMKSILRDRLDAIDLPKVLAEAESFFQKQPSTFDAARDHLVSAFPKAPERVMGYAARMQLPLVQVPTEDPWAFPASADFTLAKKWLGKKPSTDEAPHALVRRYLAAFGPATPGDAQRWSALQGLRPVFDELRPELATFKDERGRELFDLKDAPRPSEDTPAPVRLLPDFDNLVLGHDDRTRVIDDAHKGYVVTKNLQVRATFLVDGFVAGTWKVERKKKTATVVLEPFAALPKKVRGELEEEAAALSRFVEDDAPAHEVVFRPRS